MTQKVLDKLLPWKTIAVKLLHETLVVDSFKQLTCQINLKKLAVSILLFYLKERLFQNGF